VLACVWLLSPLLLQGALDNMNLFQVITIMAFFMLLPVSILFEGLPCLPSKLAAAVSQGAGGWCLGLGPSGTGQGQAGGACHLTVVAGWQGL